MVLLGSTQSSGKALQGMEDKKQTNKEEKVCCAGETNTTPCAAKLPFTTAFTIIKTELVVISVISKQLWWGYEGHADDKEILVLILSG